MIFFLIWRYQHLQQNHSHPKEVRSPLRAVYHMRHTHCLLYDSRALYDLTIDVISLSPH